MIVYTNQIQEGLTKEHSPKSGLGKIMLALAWGPGEDRPERRAVPAVG